jgi:hypothetical protein
MVSTGVTKTMLHSREFLLKPTDTLLVTVDGSDQDVDVFTRAIVVDNTPLTADAVYGTGSIVVDHNYGGTDNLIVLDNLGAGVQDADIVAYLQIDYEAGQRGNSFVRGRTTTNVSGRWRSPMYLDAETYSLVISKPGYDPEVLELIVTDAPALMATRQIRMLRLGAPAAAPLPPAEPPPTPSEGSITVDHNYGGPEIMTVTNAGGKGVADARITIYLMEDYDKGKRTQAHIRGSTTTDADGHWKAPIKLDPEMYVVLVSRAGIYKPQIIELEVVPVLETV